MVPDDSCALVTTSWDDGHPYDLRLAERLAVRGVYGSFYIPIRYQALPRMSAHEIRELRSMGMEIGAHTVRHARLTRLSEQDARRELVEGRDMLEQLLGEPVTSFSYPGGKFSRRDLRLVREAGYKLARTTVAFRTTVNFDPHAMPVGFHLYPHSRAVLARHATRERNIAGLLRWAGRWGCEATPVGLANRMSTALREPGDILHIWGHSWEVERVGLWPMLDAVLDAIAGRPDRMYTTNSGVLRAAQHQEGISTL
jgi:peptidoglycan-N-acetylglucosamine deacetylase